MLLIYQRQITIVKRVGPGVTSTGAAIQAGAWISATLMRTGSKTMSTYTTRRLGAMSIGTFCAGLAALKLTEDASRTGYTVDHVIAVGILAIAIYFGHAVATAAREARPLRAALCLTVAVGASVLAIHSTAARNIDAGIATKLEAAAHNTGRAALLSDITAAKARRSAAERAADHHMNGSTCGKLCETQKGAATDAHSTVRLLEAQLARMPEKAIMQNGTKLAAVAKRFPFVTKTEAELAEMFNDLEPYWLPLVLELGSILAWAMALNETVSRNRFAGATKPSSKPSPSETVSPPKPVSPPPSTSPAVAAIKALALGQPIETVSPAEPVAKAAALALLLADLAAGKPFPRQDDLVKQWGRPKGTVSKWLSEWQRAGLIEREVAGRRKETLVAA
jgi:hypothetical protein